MALKRVPSSHLSAKTALLVIDIQNDFCDGGLLAARNTKGLIGPLNEAISAAVMASIPTIFTRDWHPPDHSSFRDQGGPWPPHCVQNSNGAAFAPALKLPKQARILNKGVLPDDDGYSMLVGTPLRQWLKRLEIDTLLVCGIATEYCVLESVRDALADHFRVVVLADLIRPIEKCEGDAARAVAQMKGLGAELVNSRDWLAA